MRRRWEKMQYNLKFKVEQTERERDRERARDIQREMKRVRTVELWQISREVKGNEEREDC